MKKLLLIIIIAAFLLGGCSYTGTEDEPQATEPAVTPASTDTQPKEEFSFRGHKFWDSIEDVIEKEGEPDRDIGDIEDDSYIIIYDDLDIFGHEAEIGFTFVNAELYSIYGEVKKYGKSIDETYYDIKRRLIKLCGNPIIDDDPIGDGIITRWKNDEQKYVASVYMVDSDENDRVLRFGMGAFV